MTEIIDLNSKRSPVIYTVTIVHHYDDTIEFRVEDVADDPRSRGAVMSAFRRISGADEEIEKLRTDIRNAVFADSEYAAEMDRQNAALREENARLREALEPFAPDSQWIDPAIPDGRPIDAMFLAGELRAAAAAIRGKVKDEAACPEPDEAP